MLRWSEIVHLPSLFCPWHRTESAWRIHNAFSCLQLCLSGLLLRKNTLKHGCFHLKSDYSKLERLVLTSALVSFENDLKSLIVLNALTGTTQLLNAHAYLSLLQPTRSLRLPVVENISKRWLPQPWCLEADCEWSFQQNRRRIRLALFLGFFCVRIRRLCLCFTGPI